MKLLKVSTLGLILGGMCVLNVCADKMSSQGSSWFMKIEQLGNESPKFETKSVQFKDGKKISEESAKGRIDRNGNFVQTPEISKSELINTAPVNVRVFVPDEDESSYEDEEQENFEQSRFDPENRFSCPLKMDHVGKTHSSDFMRPWDEIEKFDEDFEEEDEDIDSCFARLWKDFSREMSKLAKRDKLFFQGKKAPCFGDPERKEHRKKFRCPKKWKLRRHRFVPHHPSQYTDASQFAPEESNFSHPDAPQFAPEKRIMHHPNASRFAFKRMAADQEVDDTMRSSEQYNNDFEYTHPSFRSW